MNMKQKCHFKQIILLFALGLFIFSCKNPLAQSQENQLSKETVKLKISTNLARTVLPTQFKAETSGLTWKLTGIKDGTSTDLGTWSDEDNTTAYSKMTSTEISVDVGIWDFTLDVTNSSGEKVLTGTTGSINVSTNSTLTFVMQEPTEGVVAPGQIEFTLNFPSGVVDKVEATLTEYGNAATPVDSGQVDLSTGEAGAYVKYIKTVDAGTYMLKLDLQQKDPVYTEQYKTINTYTCLIRVAPGLLSKGSDKLNSLAKLYKIKYELDNGTMPENVTKTSYNQYTKFTLPNPTKDGYIFLGWCTDEKCPSESCEQLQAADTTISISQDTTLYAKWQEVSIPSITLDIKENGNPNNSSLIQKTDCIGISVAPNSDSESVWTYFGTVSPSSADQGYNFKQGDNKVSIQMKASEKTVVAIAAARADMFFTVDTEWKTFEFNTGYLNEELTKAITIGVGLSKEVYFRNLTVTQTQTATEKTINNTLPTLSFDINKTGIQEYLRSENSNPIIQVFQEGASYSIVVQASANNFDLSIRSYATPSKLNKVHFELENVSDENLTSSLLGFSVKENEENNSSNVNCWSKTVTYKDKNNIVFPAFSNDGSSDLVPCVIQGIVDTGLEYNNSLSFSLLNFSSSPIESLEGTGKVFAIKTGPDGNQNWQQKTKLDDFSLEIDGSKSSVLQVVITDAFEDGESIWDSNSYYCQFSNYKMGSECEDIIKLNYNEQDKFVTIANESESKIKCTAKIDSNFNVVISATEVQPAIPESGLALQIGTGGANDKIYVYNKTGLENLRNLVNGTIEGTLTVGIYEGTNTFNYDSSLGGYSEFNAILLNDIELASTVEWTPIGTEDYPYIGTFDGNKHKIINLTIKETSDSPKGFFAYCNGTVKNLTVQGTYNVNSPAVGGIIGYSDEGCTVENCVSDVTITNSYSTDSTTYPSGTAGIVGFVSGDATVNISGCINLGNITAKTNIAGIVSGSTYDNNLEAIVNVNKCINVGAITSENMYIAGISCVKCESFIDTSSITNSINLGTLGTSSSAGICYDDKKNTQVENCINVGSFVGDLSISRYYPIAYYSTTDSNVFLESLIYSSGCEYDATKKSADQLKTDAPFESWSTENWSFANGRYPLPNISQNIPQDVWATVLEKAK